MKLKTALILILSLAICNFANSQDKTATGKFNNPLLGENVYVFNPSMNMSDIQIVLDTLFNRQKEGKSEFNHNRYAILFKPGHYDLDVKVGYYMEIMGLGNSPDDVVISGAVRSNTTHGRSVLTNFWRAVENLTVIPADRSTNIWGVSQAAPMRRVHIKGNLQLFDKGYASGGFLADSEIDDTVTSGPQQQWFSRNTRWAAWNGGNWNMMFVGVEGAPAGEWPEKPFTVIEETPLVREKPYLTTSDNEFFVRVPALKKNSSGPDWISGNNTDRPVPLTRFYIAIPGKDDATTINSALLQGKNILFTPGIYTFDKCLLVTHPGTIIMGIGMPSLMPSTGHSVFDVADVDGVTICGLTIDAGPDKSETLFNVGRPGSVKSHASDPLFCLTFSSGLADPQQVAPTAVW